MPTAVAWWRRPVAIDVVLVVTGAALLLLGSVRAAGGQVPPRRPLDAFAYAILVAVALAFGMHRRWPMAVLGFSVVATDVYLVLRYPYGPILLATGLAMFLVALNGPLRRSMTACGISIIAIVGAEGITALRPDRGIVVLAQLVAWTGWLLLPWALGTVLRERFELTSRRQAEERRQRLYEERLLMAREVHDIVAHGLAVISMQAGVALHVLDRRPNQAKVALEAIRDASRHSLEELRTALTMFRPMAGTEDRRATARLAQLDGLVASTAGSGVAVHTHVVGAPRELPAFIDIAAFRIVQESLTNVLRHSGATDVTVRLEYRPDAVEVEVTDNGRGVPGHGPPRQGHGLAGMAERAAAIGGILEAGRYKRGGWRVYACLPLGERTE
jgi:signal transduction histidine kinase